MKTNESNRYWSYGMWGGLAVLALGFVLWLTTDRKDFSDSIAMPDAESTQTLPPLQAASVTVSDHKPSFSDLVKPTRQLQPQRPKPVLDEAPTPLKLTRSPYPMPGEIFKKPMKPKLLAAVGQGVGFSAGGQLQAKPGQIIPWNRARQYMGQTITIEGQVVAAKRTKKVCFLNFSENWRGRFYVILFKDVLDRWPQSPDRYFKNKTIRVTGEIKKRRGSPQIQVTRKSQIQVVD